MTKLDSILKSRDITLPTKIYIVRKKQDWELTGSDHELLMGKFRVKLKKVGKTTRPFMCDLNQIPYNYTVEVTNRFKRLDLIECPKNYDAGS